MYCKIMNWMSVMALVIYFGKQGMCGVVSMHSDNYIGCYKVRTMRTRHSIYIEHNSGNACKRHCFSTHRYAATAFGSCYCMDKLPGQKTYVSDCSTNCPDQTIPGETCGGMGTFTIYDATELTATTADMSSVSISSTTLKAKTSQGKTSTVSKMTSFHLTNSNAIDDPSVTTTTNQVFKTDEQTRLQSPNNMVHETTFFKYNTGCVLICVAAAVGLVIINTICLCVCKKIRRPKQGNDEHVAGYGYISPVHVNEGDITSDGNVLNMRTVHTTNIAGTSAHMYDYVDSNTSERQ